MNLKIEPLNFSKNIKIIVLKLSKASFEKREQRSATSREKERCFNGCCRQLQKVRNFEAPPSITKLTRARATIGGTTQASARSITSPAKPPSWSST